MVLAMAPTTSNTRPENIAYSSNRTTMRALRKVRLASVDATMAISRRDLTPAHGSCIGHGKGHRIAGARVRASIPPSMLPIVVAWCAGLAVSTWAKAAEQPLAAPSRGSTPPIATAKPLDSADDVL